jgi:hypothetical protein
MVILIINGIRSHDQRVRVTTVWHVLRLRLEERPPIGSEAMNIWHKQSQTSDKGCFSSLWVGRFLAVKTYHITNYSQRPRTWNYHLVRRKQWKRDMSKRNLYTIGLNLIILTLYHIRYNLIILTSYHT